MHPILSDILTFSQHLNKHPGFIIHLIACIVMKPSFGVMAYITANQTG